MLPQSGKCLSLTWSKDILALLEPNISQTLACIWNVSILGIIYNLKQVSPTDHSVQASMQLFSMQLALIET